METVKTDSDVESKRPTNDLPMPEEPQDRFFFVHIVFFLLGLAHFIPITFYTTATQYWMDKFGDVDSSPNFLQANFGAGCVAASALSTFFSSALTKVYGPRFKSSTRIIFGMALITLGFVVSLIFVKINTDSWRVGFFVFTMFIIAINTFSYALACMSCYELLSTFPERFLTLYIAGQGIAGVFNALLQILSLAIGTSPTVSAIVYFTTGSCLMFLTLVFFVYSIKQPLYQHYYKDPILEIDSLKEMYETFKLIWPAAVQFVALMITQAALHPTVTSLVESEFKGSGQWSDTYFTPVISFLFNNSCEFVGRVLAAKLKKAITGNINTVIAIVRLVVFVFLIMTCNAQSETKHLPVLFPHDYQYIIIIGCYAFTGGYFSNVVFTGMNKYLPQEDLNKGFSVIILFSAVVCGLAAPISFYVVNVL